MQIFLSHLQYFIKIKKKEDKLNKRFLLLFSGFIKKEKTNQKRQRNKRNKEIRVGIDYNFKFSAFFTQL